MKPIERFLLDGSRIYRAGSDELMYRSNVTFETMSTLASLARTLGAQAREDIQRCEATTDPENARYFAYFSGSNARKAFTVAAMVIELDEQRHAAQPYYTRIDFRRIW